MFYTMQIVEKIVMEKTPHRFVVFQLILVLGMASFFSSAPYAGELNVSIQSLQEKQAANQNLLLLDVRSVEEFKEGHVRGAVNIPHTELDKIYQLLNRSQEKQRIVYCRSGKRAGIVLDAMREKGLTDLYHLEGDMIGWKGAGLPVEK